MVDMVYMIMNMADMEDMDIVHWTIVNVTLVNNWNIQVSLSSSSCIPRGSSDDYILSFLILPSPELVENYSCPSLVVPFFEELISRPFLDENRFRLVSHDRMSA